MSTVVNLAVGRNAILTRETFLASAMPYAAVDSSCSLHPTLTGGFCYLPIPVDESKVDGREPHQVERKCSGHANSQ
jgi:hypothetical protein